MRPSICERGVSVWRLPKTLQTRLQEEIIAPQSEASQGRCTAASFRRTRSGPCSIRAGAAIAFLSLFFPNTFFIVSLEPFCQAPLDCLFPLRSAIVAVLPPPSRQQKRLCGVRTDFSDVTLNFRKRWRRQSREGKPRAKDFVPFEHDSFEGTRPPPPPAVRTLHAIFNALMYINTSTITE